MLTPRVRRVSSQTRSLSRATAWGAMRQRGCRCEVKLKPRNFRSYGCATALFVEITLSLSFNVMNRDTLAITRSPDRRLRK